MQPSQSVRLSLFPFIRIGVGLGLFLLGITVLLPPTGLGGASESTVAMKMLRDGVGKPVEVNPDGSFKTSLTSVELGSDRYEK